MIKKTGPFLVGAMVAGLMAGSAVAQENPAPAPAPTPPVAGDNHDANAKKEHKKGSHHKGHKKGGKKATDGSQN